MVDLVDLKGGNVLAVGEFQNYNLCCIHCAFVLRQVAFVTW